MVYRAKCDYCAIVAKGPCTYAQAGQACKQCLESWAKSPLGSGHSVPKGTRPACQWTPTQLGSAPTSNQLRVSSEDHANYVQNRSSDVTVNPRPAKISEINRLIAEIDSALRATDSGGARESEKASSRGGRPARIEGERQAHEDDPSASRSSHAASSERSRRQAYEKNLYNDSEPSSVRDKRNNQMDGGSSKRLPDGSKRKRDAAYQMSDSGSSLSALSGDEEEEDEKQGKQQRSDHHGKAIKKRERGPSTSHSRGPCDRAQSKNASVPTKKKRIIASDDESDAEVEAIPSAHAQKSKRAKREEDEYRPDMQEGGSTSKRSTGNLSHNYADGGSVRSDDAGKRPHKTRPKHTQGHGFDLPRDASESLKRHRDNTDGKAVKQELVDGLDEPASKKHKNAGTADAAADHVAKHSSGLPIKKDPLRSGQADSSTSNSDRHAQQSLKSGGGEGDRKPLAKQPQPLKRPPGFASGASTPKPTPDLLGSLLAGSSTPNSQSGSSTLGKPNRPDRIPRNTEVLRAFREQTQEARKKLYESQKALDIMAAGSAIYRYESGMKARIGDYVDQGDAERYTVQGRYIGALISGILQKKKEGLCST